MVIVATVIIVFFGAYIYRVVRKRSRAVVEERVSLLTGTESFMDDSLIKKDQELSSDSRQAPNTTALVREDSGYSSGDEGETGIPAPKL